jgi:Spherulation-specific family 4
MVLRRLKSVVVVLLATVLLATLVAALLVAITSRRVRAGPTIELVPAYFYPSGAGLAAWNQLASDAGSVRIEAILNPASGPGTTRDPNYVTVVNHLRNAGGSVFGYVSTEYGNRDITTVISEIQKYVFFYNINGLFIDEMAADQENRPYYEKIYEFIKAMDSDFKVVGNPGMPYTLESYLAAADTLVIFEGTDIAYADFQPLAIAPWVANYPPDRFANIVYAVRSDTKLHWVLGKARLSNAGSIFITDGGLPNPYAGLPFYWDRELEAIRELDLAAPPPAKTLPMK